MAAEASAERKIQELEDALVRKDEEIRDHKQAYTVLEKVSAAREQVLAAMVDKLIAEVGSFECHGC